MKDRWLLPLALFSLMSYSTCTFNGETPILKGDVYGKVIDMGTGNAIPHAKVFIGVKENRTIKADSKGRYSFEDIEAGNYVLSAASDQYLSHFFNVVVSENQPVEIDVQMEKRDQLSIVN